MSYITNNVHGDGFGSQYQLIISCILYAKRHGLTFVYTPINRAEHNYDGDPNFLKEMNEYMNLTPYYKKVTDIKGKKINRLKYEKYTVDVNINEYVTPESVKEIQQLFWEKKNRQMVFAGFEDKTNVVVHVRRPNKNDDRILGSDTPDDYYINLMNFIRQLKLDKPVHFHIHSQGSSEMFDRYMEHNDVTLYLNADYRVSFTQMVAADILCTSASSFSYAAALLCEGTVYFKPFWHNNPKYWKSGEIFY